MKNQHPKLVVIAMGIEHETSLINFCLVEISHWDKKSFIKLAFLMLIICLSHDLIFIRKMFQLDECDIVKYFQWKTYSIHSHVVMTYDYRSILFEVTRVTQFSADEILIEYNVEFIDFCKTLKRLENIFGKVGTNVL
ncbi:CLUMA_CG017801, isoform A [Clunio marinus]|uniref:CLUMA_CG017801, isoform A n=1 Tax=Clunio marinus TaxID=568069 RepID=A0A1J1IX07_9DIPT|nr:CLUMA_CG017801, isoform A [Clunio marinus]